MEKYPMYMASQTRVMPHRGGNICKNFLMGQVHETCVSLTHVSCTKCMKYSPIFDKIRQYDMKLVC